jgi:hypothetical protein
MPLFSIGQLSLIFAIAEKTELSFHSHFAIFSQFLSLQADTDFARNIPILRYFIFFGFSYGHDRCTGQY